MYILPSGLCMYWCDSIFIDRKNPKDAYTQIETSAAKTFKNKARSFISLLFNISFNKATTMNDYVYFVGS